MFLRLCKRKLLKTKHHTNPGAYIYIYTLKLFVDGSKRMRKWIWLSHIACCDPCISVAESRPLWAVTRATTSRNRMRRSLPTCHCLLLHAQTTFRSPPSGPLGVYEFRHQSFSYETRVLRNWMITYLKPVRINGEEKMEKVPIQMDRPTAIFQRMRLARSAAI